MCNSGLELTLERDAAILIPKASPHCQVEGAPDSALALGSTPHAAIAHGASKIAATSKSPAHDPNTKVNASCAGREPLTRRRAFPTKLLGCGSDARGLRTGAPIAPPGVPVVTRRVLEALISDLDWPAMARISLYRSRCQKDRKHRRRCCGNRELTHCRLPQFEFV